MLKLKIIVFFIKFISICMLNRNFGNFIDDVAQKYENDINVADLRRLEKLHKKAKKVDLDLNFLKNLNCVMA